MRTNEPSGNLLFMDTFDGQESMDFFLPSLSNHPTPHSNSTCQQTAQRKLGEASRFPFSNGSNDFASTDEAGNSATSLLYPFKVILEPTTEMRQESANWLANERTAGNFGAEYFEEMAQELLTVPLRTNADGTADNTVWNVMAQSQPGATEELIGTIEITSSFISSLWADTQMFFKHEDFRLDLDGLERRTRRSWTPFENNLPDWDNTTIESLPTSREDAEEVVQIGATGSFGCPFAWLIEDINTATNGIW